MIRVVENGELSFSDSIWNSILKAIIHRYKEYLNKIWSKKIRGIGILKDKETMTTYHLEIVLFVRRLDETNLRRVTTRSKRTDSMNLLHNPMQYQPPFHVRGCPRVTHLQVDISSETKEPQTYQHKSTEI